MLNRNIKDLLLALRLDPSEVVVMLRPFGFQEIEQVDANLQAMGGDPRTRKLLAEFLGELLSLLSESPDPDLALNYFERFTQAAINKTNLFSYLKDSPRTLELLVKTCWGSPFMAEVLIRDPELLYWVTDERILHKERGKYEIARDLSAALKGLRTKERQLDLIRTFKRKEILRIGVRDLLRLSDVNETVSSLSNLGEVLIQKIYEICDAQMQREFGVPSHKDKSGRWVRTGYTVLGMGKLGGGELNFSSDVDLIYLYESDRGHTRRSGSRKQEGSISNDDYFNELSRRITGALSEMTNEGYVYRVDLRLRPQGSSGEMATSLKEFKSYYRARGENWERMALLKTWPVGGDSRLGKRFLSAVRPFLYDRPFDKQARNEVWRIKERINEKIEVRGQKNRHVKLGFGGIREIEFIVQALQLAYGKRYPKVRERNTMKGLQALSRYRILSKEEGHPLSQAYLFLRDVENKLQMVHDFQVHSLPEEEAEVRACAFRIGYRDAGPKKAEQQLMRDYTHHTGVVNGIFRRVFQANRGTHFTRSFNP